MSGGRWFEPSEEAKTLQCRLVLAELSKGPKTTLDLRAVGVMSPAARVMSLKRAGIGIVTLRQGRQGLYVLIGGAA